MTVEAPRVINRVLWLYLKAAIWAIAEILESRPRTIIKVGPKRRAQLHRVLMMFEAEFHFGFEGMRDFGVIIQRGGARIDKGLVESAFPTNKSYSLEEALFLVERACKESELQYSHRERNALKTLSNLLGLLAARA